MPDPIFEPTQQEILRIEKIKNGSEKSKKIHDTTEEIETRHREGATEALEQEFTNAPIL